MNINTFKFHIYKPQASLLAITVLLLIFSISTVSAATTITSAEWKDGRSKLVVKGTGTRGDLAEIVNAYNDSFIGSTSISRKGKWSVSKRRLSPVPCAVKLKGSSTVFAVSSAPESCSPKPPSANVAPLCSIDFPSENITINVDETIDYTSTITDSDGTIASVNWQFSGGNPSSSTIADPNAITYAVAGIYTTTLSATDNDGAICDEQLVNVTVEDVTPPPPPTLSGEYTVLAVNDLGMHCADLDYQIFSILPPFNVVHAQVIKKGTASSLPQLMDDSLIETVYTATSSVNDPVAPNSINTTSDNSIYGVKSNFWDDSGHLIPLSGSVDNNSWGGLAYGVLYPSVLAGILVDPTLELVTECGTPDLVNRDNSTDCPSILNLFEPLAADTGIPVPDLVELSMGALVVHQQTMPGPLNLPQPFNRFDSDLPFFTKFGFGANLQNRNWWAADGIPIVPVDDQLHINSYPLMKVDAREKATSNILASLDVVTPVASEADCQLCHAEPMDCAVTDPTMDCTGVAVPMNGTTTAISGTEFEVITLDSDPPPPGATALEELLNTAKINILRLHDAKHGAQYTSSIDGSARVCDPANDPDDHCLDSRRAIQCSQCHYSPALDLTQGGPVDEPQQGANGRQQTRHITMSRAMHGHHGTLPTVDSSTGDVGNSDSRLFPAMPEPVNRNVNVAEQVLQDTCYQCHPGKKTQCLRGAMFSGGVVCQDCHGDMEEVGNDFSIKAASSAHSFPDNFILDGSLRVPWASEAKCQSCHTGDAVNKNHPVDAIIASDGIRLLKAYKTEFLTFTDAEIPDPVKVASVIDSPASRFAENQADNGNDVLYRLSVGHGGVKCEGCHNSTHAIWPNAQVNANDNIAAQQLQGHHGTLIECASCHGTDSFSIDDFKENLDSNGQMKGPHGMHPVDNAMWNKDHKEVDKESGRQSCRSCHGNDGTGTVLSLTAAERTLQCKGEGGNVPCGDGDLLTVPKGTEVGCGLCHTNFINKQ